MTQLPSAEDLTIYLQPTQFIDSDSPAVITFARSAAGNANTGLEAGVKLYYAVRDSIRYSPYDIQFDPARYKASWLLQKKVGFCIQKAILLAAAARAMGIPSRLGFADVRNHLETRRLIELMRTDEFFYHGYTELHLNGKWVKATPAFNLSLCRRFGVKPLEFDGQTDSIFHPFDQAGNRHMEYIRDRGQHADFPLDDMIRVFKEGYPHLFTAGGPGWPGKGDFEREAAAER
ncbi:MAG: transglutaminase-like domain-containing protein [Anaerolineae bacterium]